MRWRNRHDPAVRVTGYSYRFEGHDEAKADAARHRRAEHERQTRKLADSRIQSKPKVREFKRVGGE
jgi:hypothetical protein